MKGKIMINYDKTQFNNDQIAVIEACIAAGHTPNFVNPAYDWAKMRLAYHAIRNGVDLSPYLANFNHEQLDEIRIGLVFGIDVSKYADPTLSIEQMQHVRMSLEFHKE